MNRPLSELLFALCLLDTLVSVVTATSCGTCKTNEKPNIVFILADDMGFNDVSFHGSNQIPTPCIDALAYNGVILNQFYTMALCTPSRAALLTGIHPTKLGLQHYVIAPSDPRGLTEDVKLMPQYLKKLDYATHLVGKWHLGYSCLKYTPTYRGFDTFCGYFNGFLDYYNHTLTESYTNFSGLDMRCNGTILYNNTRYATDLFCDEAVRLIDNHNCSQPLFLYLAQIAPHSGNAEELLQAPQEKINKFCYINDTNRQTYAAMVSTLDDSVCKVVDALDKKGILNNTIIIFMSDNGAPTVGPMANSGSNSPFRGTKDTFWEGGVRVAAAIWSSEIENPRRVSNEIMHMTDWLPTLLSAAGMSQKQISELNIDGYNMWPTIAYNQPNPRKEILLNIDPIVQSPYKSVAIRNVKYKYVSGRFNGSPEWLKPPGNKCNQSYPLQDVLTNKVGSAIGSLTTNKLTAQDIMDLREQATVRCNVEEDKKVPCIISSIFTFGGLGNVEDMGGNCSACCLYDLENDPCEMINIIEKKPEIATELELALKRYTVKWPSNVPFMPPDLRANPSFYNNTWVSWLNEPP